MFKVWYINQNGKAVTTIKKFPTLDKAIAYAKVLEEKGKIHEDCLMGEGARFIKA